MVERRLEAQLRSTPDSALAVVAIDDGSEGALAVACVAYRLASDGTPVTLADAADARPLRRLLRAKRSEHGFQTVKVGDRAASLVVCPEDPAEMGGRPFDAGMTLILASVDPAFGAEHIATWAKTAVVLITAGKSSSTKITAVAQMLRQAGVTVRSVILIGADPDDETISVAEVDEAQELRRHLGVLQSVSR
jgi:hypothetical protein